MSTAGLPGPLRCFTAHLDELGSGGVPDMDRAARHLADLAADTDFFAPLIAQIPAQAPGDRRKEGPSGALGWCSSTGRRG